MRVELCPELSGSSRYTLWATRYDNTTEKCYMTGQKGPCGNNMIFYSVAGDAVYGECDCNVSQIYFVKSTGMDSRSSIKFHSMTSSVDLSFSRASMTNASLHMSR